MSPKPSKTILLIGNYLPDAQESMQRFLEALSAGLLERGIVHEVLRPPVIFGRLSRFFPRFKKILGYLDKYGCFPLWLAWKTHLQRFKGVHITDHSNALYRPWLNGHPALVNGHDLLAIRGAHGDLAHHHVGIMGKILQKWILKHLHGLDGAAFNSDKTRADFHQWVLEPPLMERRIYMGLNYPYQKLAPLQVLEALSKGFPWVREEPYLLHVGSNSWYKNRKGIVEAFLILKKRYRIPHRLVLAGEPLANPLRKRLQGEGLSDAVVDAGKMDNATLNAWYSGAKALVFPSLEEGFGWPIVEAMASGCPVITTAKAPMTEVGGEVAYYLDPYPETLEQAKGWAHAAASKIHAILTLPQILSESRKALMEKHLEGFSEKMMVQSYIDFYKDLFEHKSFL
jgi:glycosyltransferase involved in cell wall biosynthesis